jgi:hypothetical protein
MRTAPVPSIRSSVAALVAVTLLATRPAAGTTNADLARSRLVARLYAPTHHPKAGAPWRIRITARTAKGKPVRAEVRYQFLFTAWSSRVARTTASAARSATRSPGPEMRSGSG